MNTAPAFASVTEAAEMVRAGLGFLAAADATALAAETQAQCLQILEQANAMSTAARTSILAAFTAAQGYTADADYSPRAWLIHQTRVTKGAAVGLHRVGPRRAAAHPQVAARAGGRGDIGVVRPDDLPWTDKLPEDCRPGRGCDLADGGAGGRGPARTWPGWPRRSTPGPCPRGPGQGPGAGVRGPVGAAGDHVRRRRGADRGADARSARRWWARCWTRCRPRPGAEDTRSQAQRYHDALQEAMRPL